MTEMTVWYNPIKNKLKIIETWAFYYVLFPIVNNWHYIGDL